ncbi:MAG TPA: FAD-dependent oxidoreductase [Streptosporangiaceae bacterium]|nr:FAD-dependent oxidoreductase [Streptosporangiaceae bacterium]
MSEPSPARPVVAVIGGGYGGTAVAKALDDIADVVLVEPKDAFVHNVASLRALVDPSWLPRVYFPYEGLLANGRVVTGRAVKADVGQVTLASGEQIRADYIVLATGSAYPFPAKSDVDLTAAAHDKVRAAHAALAGARRVLLIGAGPVGIELAGEIKEVWPDKHVTLLDVADDVLGERFRPDLKAELRRQLTEAGVELLLSSPLREPPAVPPGERREFTVATQAGAEVTADIWFRCYGVSPVSDYLAGDLAGARRPDGFIEVTPFLQVAGQDRVFAVGDVSAADHNMAGIAGRQAQVVADNIRSLITGAGSLRAHEPTAPGIFVPIGPRGGSGQRAGVDQLFPPEAVAQAKGRDMMVDRFATMFGVTGQAPPPSGR